MIILLVLGVVLLVVAVGFVAGMLDDRRSTSGESRLHSPDMVPSLIVVGLGNPGKSYERTRHNVGFMALDALHERYGIAPWALKQKFSAEVAEARMDAIPILLVKPITYMNRSGESVRKIVQYAKVSPAEHLLVLCDDIDLPLGTVRLRKTGGPGTHNGLKSLVEQFGEDFPRLRIGLGAQPPGADLKSWILSKMTAEEERTLREAMDRIPALLTEFVFSR